MIDILNKYLILHNSLGIPGVGTLCIEHVPAFTDFINKQISPPGLVYKFDKYFDSPDKEFFSYLSSRLNIPDDEAVKQYNGFSQDFSYNLNIKEKVLWKEVGFFKKGTSGEIEFEPLNEPLALYAPVTAERIVRTDASHAMLVGDQEKTSKEMSELLNEEKNRKVLIERKAQKPIPEKEPQLEVNKKQGIQVGLESKVWYRYALILFVIALTFLIIYFARNGFSIKSIGNQEPVSVVE